MINATLSYFFCFCLSVCCCLLFRVLVHRVREREKGKADELVRVMIVHAMSWDDYNIYNITTKKGGMRERGEKAKREGKKKVEGVQSRVATEERKTEKYVSKVYKEPN